MQPSTYQIKTTLFVILHLMVACKHYELYHMPRNTFSVCMQSQLLDPAVKGTLNVLQAAKECGVRRVVLTSSISAIVPSPGWPADTFKDENCWTDVEYCKKNEVAYLKLLTLVLDKNSNKYSPLKYSSQ